MSLKKIVNMSSPTNLLVLVIIINTIKSVLLKEYKCETNDITFAKPLSQKLWPKAVIPYEFHSKFKDSAVFLINHAIEEIEIKTCIRFRPRVKHDEDYIRFNLSTRVCAQADVCREGGPQYVFFKSDCISHNSVIHQLGHTLCLRHEHQRVDRNMYLSFEGCKIVDIPPMNVYSSLNHLFDYTSQMAFRCDSCLGGHSKLEGLPGCGSKVTNGLSVIDADRLNELYECDGPCFTHRWRRHTQLTAQDVKDAFPFGYIGETDIAYYLCRAFIKGDILPGKYRLDKKICYVGYDGKEVKMRGVDIQVLVVPNIHNVSRNGHLRNLIPIGRTAKGVKVYGAVAELDWNENEMVELSIGKVYEDNMKVAYFSLDGSVIVKQVEGFEMISCRTIADGPKEMGSRPKRKI